MKAASLQDEKRAIWHRIQMHIVSTTMIANVSERIIPAANYRTNT